ncbi:M48 family metalloprotease [Polaromonas sp. YR568]|uniref:M48 family metalloprotease n=1 Tax=Polaromonas sp. YR568 TaxID=1855301 RepID=UPI000B8056AD|nr:M48 family metalloprotease [Polaromonas sp. YR568]
MVSANFSLAQAPTTSTAGPTSGSLPSLGETSELAAAAERRIGDRIAASIYRDPDYIDDPVLADYVQGIWLPLVAAARTRGELHAELEERFAWQLFLIRDRSINAFALPGGYFGLHLGLVAAVGSPDEMAAVLGHELSHVTQRHISRMLTQQARQTPWMIAAMLLGALAAGKSGDVASAAIVGGQAVAAQNQLNFSRDMEREADRVGFGVMTDAGFESRGMTAMFEKLQQAARLNDNGSFPYLRSHPLTTERIAEAQARVQLVSAEAAKPTREKEIESGKARLLHAMMASRARILAAPGVDGLRSMVAEAQRRPVSLAHLQSPATPENVRDAGALYGGAFAAAQLRDFAVAKTLLGQLKALGTQDVPQVAGTIDLLGTEIDLLAGVVPPAASSTDISRATSRAEVLTQAQALMAANRVQAVSDRLQTWVALHPKDAMAWQLLATAYGRQNQNIRAVRADAESRAAQLDYSAALDRFKAAQGLMRSNPSGADYVEGSILDTRTRQIESLVKEQALQDKLDR